MSRMIGAIAVVVIAIPVSLKCLADGSINLNRILLNVVGTVQEIVTRQPANWDAPETRRDGQEKPQRGGDDL
jgi:hypothetical protein